jgi:hypothetical protein
VSNSGEWTAASQGTCGGGTYPSTKADKNSRLCHPDSWPPAHHLFSNPVYGRPRTRRDDDLPEAMDTADIERVNTERDTQAPPWLN